MSYGFLGAGMMAQAIIGGLVRSEMAKPQHIMASDPHDGCRGKVEALGVTVTPFNVDVAAAADILVLAVKPDTVLAVLAEIAPAFDVARHLLVSIAAGIPLVVLQQALPPGARVVRVMPNTPCLVGASAAAFAAGAHATAADHATAAAIFGAVGICEHVKEKDLDAVTGLSGSGPAYAFLAIEALSDGGVRAGLPRAVATRLAAQTLLGAAKMVLETGKHPGELKDQVTSPGGTTIAGVHELERGAFRATLINAVAAASARATEMGRLYSAPK